MPNPHPHRFFNLSLSLSLSTSPLIPTLFPTPPTVTEALMLAFVLTLAPRCSRHYKVFTLIQPLVFVMP